MSTSAVAKMPNAKIEIPTLAEEDVANFPAATASAEVVKEFGHYVYRRYAQGRSSSLGQY